MDLDQSSRRSDKAWKVIFDQAGLRLVQEQVQDGLPEGLYAVKMLVCSFIKTDLNSRLKLSLIGMLSDNSFPA